MNWYDDPAGLAAKITGAITAVVALVAAVVAAVKGAGTLDTVLAAVPGAVAGIIAVLVILRGRQDSIAPKTVRETPEVAMASAERTHSDAHS